MNLHDKLAKYLKKRRGEQSQTAFAKKLGISQSSYQRLEIGDQNTTLKTLEFLTKRLKCSVCELFGGDKSK